MNDDVQATHSLSLSHNGLNNLAWLSQEKDFTFFVGEKFYQCNKILASFISPNVAHLLSSDPFCNKYSIEYKDPYNVFEFFISLMTGSTVDIDVSNYDIVFHIASLLGNTEIQHSLSLMPYFTKRINLINAIPRLISKSSCGVSFESESSFIASHFYAFSNEDLNKLNDSDLAVILSQQNLQIQNESMLFNYLMDRPKPSTVLLSYVLFEYLTEVDIDRFLTFFTDEQTMNGGLWSAISRRLSMNIESIDTLDSRHTRQIDFDLIFNDYQPFSIAFNKDEPLDGIISYLNLKNDENAYSIQVSGTLWNSPKVVADMESTEFWSSSNSPDSWFMYDFQDRIVSVTDYTLRGDNMGTLRDWVIEGSLDQKNWVELDKHTNSDSLKGLYATKSFKVKSTGNYRYIRIRQISNELNGENYFNLCCFELFGSLSVNPKNYLYLGLNNDSFDTSSDY